MQTHAEKQTVTITLEDVNRLSRSVMDLRTAIGRDIVHGDLNGDSADCIVENILSDVAVYLVGNWAHDFFPDHFDLANVEAQQFPDDEDPDIEQAYAAAGF